LEAIEPDLASYTGADVRDLSGAWLMRRAALKASS